MSKSITIVTGNVGQDARINEVNGGAKAISFSVATNRKYPDKETGELIEVSTWFNCTKWVSKGGSVEVAKYIRKGAIVTVIGEISCSYYKTETGEIKTSLDLRVNDLDLVSSPTEKK